MALNNSIFLLVLLILSLLFNKYFFLILNKFNSKLLIDDQFKKPQAFHEFPISITGGLGIYLLLMITFSYLFLENDIIYYQYVSFCTLFFLLGLVDDLKIYFFPKIRLLLMILFLIFLVQYNNFYISKTGIEFINNWLQSSQIFSLIFVCLCFLFIINGANLIDGYNGLLGFHSLIILINLLLINYFKENYNLAFLLFCAILIIVSFIKFNFPRAKIFLGDSGSYLMGTFVAISAIETSIANPDISPFYFCILLFYLFFEVFFSFFRKLFLEKKSPIYPDTKHLHMLLYKILLNNNNDKIKSNYLVSIIINFIYLILIIPTIFQMDNGFFCKYYSIVFFAVYVISYKFLNEQKK